MTGWAGPLRLIPALLVAICGIGSTAAVEIADLETQTGVAVNLCLESADSLDSWLRERAATDEQIERVRQMCDSLRIAHRLDHPTTQIEMMDLRKRGSLDAPDGYTPTTVTCPSNRPAVRPVKNAALSDGEQAFLAKRHPVVATALRSWLKQIAISDFDVDGFMSAVASAPTPDGRVNGVPNIGLALSGGGYRAMLTGAGAVLALDNRTTNATKKGHVGGLYQALTYVTGLSGGSWTVGSLNYNTSLTVEMIMNGQTQNPNTWNTAQPLVQGPADLGAVDYWGAVKDQVDGKHDTGKFNVSLTDYWGRALAYQLVDDPETGGANFTWSSVASDDKLKSGEMPMPILVANAVKTGVLNITLNATTVMEFSPFEMGSFNPSLAAFAPIRYLGSNFTNGVVKKGSDCIRGFDNAGFVMGTSSSLFNAGTSGYLALMSLPEIVNGLVESIVKTLSAARNDIAVYSPNPFYRYSNITDKFASSNVITMVDGGMDNQNLPLDPLIAPVRKMDVIIAVDSSADTDNNWPAGGSLIATFRRSMQNPVDGAAVAMPQVATNRNTFINYGLNNRPVFFGCDSSISSNGIDTPPLIVYMPNGPYTYMSNRSTATMAFALDDRDAIINNGYALMSQANSTLDEQWPTCLGCAVLSRTAERVNVTLPGVCADCFTKYCYNNENNPDAPGYYDPELKVASSGAGVAMPPVGILGLVGLVGLAKLAGVLP